MAGIIDAAKDAALDYIADNGDRLDMVSDAAPTAGSPLSGLTSLGNVALTTGDGLGDWTIGNGDTSGRKLTLGAQEITASGNGSCVNYVVSDGTTILATASTTSKTIVSGTSYETPALDVWELRDATEE